MGVRRLTELPGAPLGRAGWPWTEVSPHLPDTMPDGSSWPRISVVTPSYNQGRFIEETIRSVLLQRYPDLEYVVIDGGSTDDSIEIIRKYEPSLAYWVSEPDKGQADAINKGWQRATGEILAWLNSDDVYTPEALRCAAEAMVRHPEAGIVYGSCECIDERGADLGVRLGQPFDLAEMLRTGGNHIPQPSAFIRASALQQVGALDAGFRMAMDYDLWIRMALRYGVIFSPGTWSQFRLHASAKSTVDALQDRLERLEIVERLYSRADLPSRLVAVGGQARAWPHIRLVRSLVGAGRLNDACRHLGVAIRLAPGTTLWHAKGPILEMALGHRVGGALRRIVRR